MSLVNYGVHWLCSWQMWVMYLNNKNDGAFLSLSSEWLMKWPHIQDFYGNTPLLLSLWGSGFIREMQTGCTLTFSILLEGTEVKLCPLELAEWPWWEPSCSMIPLQIDLRCHSIKWWKIFFYSPIFLSSKVNGSHFILLLRNVPWK